MNFASLQFAVFFVGVFLVYWHLTQKQQNLFLLFTSLFFYACWDWRFLSLILLSIISNFYCGLWIARSTQAHWRKFWLMMALLLNLSLLVYFKYANFFVDSALALAAHFDWHISQVTLGITLPVGISFYIFQSLSYSLDIYRRELEPKHSLLDFATFVAFFPQLVAGPIVRAKEFLFQLESRRVFSGTELEEGFVRFMTGFFKKVFIADNLAIYLVDPVFSDPASYSSGALWLAMLGYAVQIYADFSGYSNMAIGCALMLGFKLPENFRYPYLATDFSDFWRRWHMTMSRFFRDYVYIPLGGNRMSYGRNMVNLAATTLISGLWHGASWTFVVWGGLHGVYIACNHVVRDMLTRFQLNTLHPGWVLCIRLPRWLLVQLLVCLAWIVFRSPDFASAAEYLQGLFVVRPTDARFIELPPVLLLCFAAFTVDHIYGWLEEKEKIMPLHKQTLLLPILLVCLILLIFNGKPEGVNPFIYFQF